VVVRVTYLFGLHKESGAGQGVAVDLPGGATIFEALQRLDLSRLELHAAVNGASATDGTVLREGDEVTLIPAIQGGAAVSLTVPAA
jgi:sulfur carrier protein ThiS